MEDNNAISQQSDAVTNENLLKENAQLKDAVRSLYARVKQLEETWMLNRCNFLMEIIKSKNFGTGVQAKAKEEVLNFLFPKAETEETKKN